MKFNNTWGPATVLMTVAALIIMGVGGAVVIAGNMTFSEYLDDLKVFAGAVGLLAVGRGIMLKNTPHK